MPNISINTAKYVGRTRIREPKNEMEERSLLAEVTPKATLYNTKWVRKIFEDWQQNRSNKNPQVESVGYEGVNLRQMEDLYKHQTRWNFTLQLELLAV